MASNDLVSVTLVTYNSGRYIKRCLESVLAQKGPQIEIVVVQPSLVFLGRSHPQEVLLLEPVVVTEGPPVPSSPASVPADSEFTGIFDKALELAGA